MRVKAIVAAGLMLSHGALRDAQLLGTAIALESIVKPAA